MPILTIDGRSVEVPVGTKVIEAAARVGISIPRFCYHPALGSVGACRVCAVGFLEGPVKGVQMSCMIDAQDAMVVSTTDPEALDFRRHVIEWLMMNHPHDCPVCDEGGQCLLQEETISGGHGVRRYLGRKRTFQDQDLGPRVQHEMNRCIHCYRCRRFYQDFAGGRDLGALQLASHTYFGRFGDGTLESPFSGNLIDVCPTGVFTDKPSRFKGRRWDFERAPSICLECSLGCATTVSARYREVVRVEARFDPDVNGHFICDRGRYAFGYANASDRPRRARVAGRETSVEEALAAAAERLGKIPAGAVACLGGTQSSLEAVAALARLAVERGWHSPAFFEDALESRTVRAAAAGLTSALATSLRVLEKADFVLVINVDPLVEAPMLALALRQAFRGGARIAVVGSRAVSLPFDALNLVLRPEELEHCLAALAEWAIAQPDAAPDAWFLPIADALRRSRTPIVVCGTVARRDPPEAAARLAAALAQGRGQAGLAYVMPGANAFGAALVDGGASSVVSVIEAIECGEIRGLVVVESDPLGRCPDRARVEAALGRLDVLVALDCRASATVGAAHVFLPSSTVFESGGWFVNHEGRMRRAEPAFRGGVPLAQVGAGGHPPRTFRPDVPGGEPEPAGELLRRLSGALQPEAPWDGHPLEWLRERCPAFGALRSSRDR